MKTFTWNMLAALRPSFGHLNAFDLCFDDFPVEQRSALLNAAISELYVPGSPSQAFAQTLGFTVTEDGVTVTDETAVERAFAFAIIIEGELDDDGIMSIEGSLAQAIGHDSLKEAQKDSSILAQLVELTGAALGMFSDQMPCPTAQANVAMRTRIMGQRPAIAA